MQGLLSRGREALLCVFITSLRSCPNYAENCRVVIFSTPPSFNMPLDDKTVADKKASATRKCLYSLSKQCITDEPIEDAFFLVLAQFQAIHGPHKKLAGRRKSCCRWMDDGVEPSWTPSQKIGGKASFYLRVHDHCKSRFSCWMLDGSQFFLPTTPSSLNIWVIYLWKK